MSHHSSLPPAVDEAVRLFIRRHKRGLRWGCLAVGLLALFMIAVAGWGLLRGAILLKDVVKDSVAGKIPAIQFPLEWEKPLGDSALAQLRGQYQFVTDRQLLDPLMDRLRQKSAALGSREFLSFVQPFNELKAALGITAEK